MLYEVDASAKSETWARRRLKPTMISTTRTAILQSELPRVRRLVKDSCPGVSMINKPGILNSGNFIPVYVPDPMLILDQLPEGAGKWTYSGLQNSRLFDDSVHREVGCTNLLGDTSSFTLLDIGLSNLWRREKGDISR